MLKKIISRLFSPLVVVTYDSDVIPNDWARDIFDDIKEQLEKTGRQSVVFVPKGTVIEEVK